MHAVLKSGRRAMRGLREAWRYRRFVTLLVSRDIKIRYTQTVIGSVWVLLQPFLEMVVLTIIFGDFFQKTAQSIPYPLFVYCGLLPWAFFANAIMGASTSVIGHSDMIKRIYFPRFLVPASSVAGKLVDLAMSFCVLLGMMAFYGFPLRAEMLLMPVFTLLLMGLASGIGFFVAGINSIYRDLGLALPYFLRLGMLMTPVIYPTDAINERWRWIVSYNPLTQIIKGFRYSLLGYGTLDPWAMAWTCFWVVAFIVAGLVFFRRMEKRFLDMI